MRGLPSSMLAAQLEAWVAHHVWRAITEPFAGKPLLEAPHDASSAAVDTSDDGWTTWTIDLFVQRVAGAVTELYGHVEVSDRAQPAWSRLSEDRHRASSLNASVSVELDVEADAVVTARWAMSVVDWDSEHGDPGEVEIASGEVHPSELHRAQLPEGLAAHYRGSNSRDVDDDSDGISGPHEAMLVHRDAVWFGTAELSGDALRQPLLDELKSASWVIEYRELRNGRIAVAFTDPEGQPGGARPAWRALEQRVMEAGDDFDYSEFEQGDSEEDLWGDDPDAPEAHYFMGESVSVGLTSGNIWRSELEAAFAEREQSAGTRAMLGRTAQQAWWQVTGIANALTWPVRKRFADRGDSDHDDESVDRARSTDRSDQFDAAVQALVDQGAIESAVRWWFVAGPGDANTQVVRFLSPATSGEVLLIWASGSWHVPAIAGGRLATVVPLDERANHTRPTPANVLTTLVDSGWAEAQHTDPHQLGSLVDQHSANAVAQVLALPSDGAEVDLLAYNRAVEQAPRWVESRYPELPPQPTTDFDGWIVQRRDFVPSP